MIKKLLTLFATRQRKKLQSKETAALEAYQTERDFLN